MTIYYKTPPNLSQRSKPKGAGMDPDCPCRDLDDAHSALMVVESALAAAQDRIDILRAQVARLQATRGAPLGLTIEQAAERCGVQVPTIYQWRFRYPDAPRKHAFGYDAVEIESFLTRHPKLGKRSQMPNNV